MTARRRKRSRVAPKVPPAKGRTSTGRPQRERASKVTGRSAVAKVKRRAQAKAPPKRRSPPRPALPASVGKTPERRALDAVAWMRRGKSLHKAAKLAHTKPSTVRRHARDALAKLDDGRYTPVFDDRIPREVFFLTPEGRIPLTVRSSRTASLIGQYWAAVDKYLRGDPRALAPFARASFVVGKRRYRFLTDLPTLDRLANVGEVQFHDLYVSIT